MLEVDLSPDRAKAFLADLVGATRPLAQFPSMGRAHPEFDDPNIRELVHAKYRIAYRIEERDVYSLSVLHGATDVAGRLRRQFGGP